MIRNTLRKIKNYLTDVKQEPETVYIPLAKLPVERLTEVVESKEEVKLVSEASDLGIFKTQKVKDRASKMHPFVVTVMFEMAVWVQKELGIHPIVTETVTTKEEDELLKRVSAGHPEGRAFDLRTRNWKPADVERFEKYFEDKYGSLGAIGIKAGKPNLLVHHDTGHGLHFHVQFNKSYALTINLTEEKLG